MKVNSLALSAVLIVVVSYDTAYAYIDPASGSYILQMALAGLLGALFALKMYWKKVKAFLTSRFRNSEASYSDK